jgi:hypothetical protein
MPCAAFQGCQRSRAGPAPHKEDWRCSFRSAKIASPSRPRVFALRERMRPCSRSLRTCDRSLACCSTRSSLRRHPYSDNRARCTHSDTQTQTQTARKRSGALGGCFHTCLSCMCYPIPCPATFRHFPPAPPGFTGWSAFPFCAILGTSQTRTVPDSSAHPADPDRAEPQNQ